MDLLQPAGFKKQGTFWCFEQSPRQVPVCPEPNTIQALPMD